MALHEFRPSARFLLLYETGKEPEKYFTICVHVYERYEGTGPTKLKAKYHAAKAALQKAFHANFPDETVLDIGTKIPLWRCTSFVRAQDSRCSTRPARNPKIFLTMSVHVDNERYEGTGLTKQKAKYHAAKAALQKAFHANFSEETGVLDISKKNIMALHEFRPSARFMLLYETGEER